ncbi:MAG TPA: gliding motility-associated C-terminal domain-containing protein [Chryseolinea sp.]|nr:gliding motility-associated C-terminal domain-containing protein [Chryseolinea sp.]
MLLSALTDTYAQYAWFEELEGNDFVAGGNLSIDVDDAIYSIGNFTNGVTVFGETFSGSGGYIVKATKRGHLIWVHQIVHGSLDAIIKIRSDGSGNIYIMGSCNQNITIDGQLFFGSQGTSYVAKLNSDGNLLWFRQIGVHNIFTIDVNSQGDLALIGRLFGTVTINGSLLSCDQCSFGAVLTTTGAYRWAKTLGNNSFPISATIDDNGNSYFNGTFSGIMTLNEKNIAGSGNYTLFFAKMNSLGTCSWLNAANQIVPQIYEDSWPQSQIVQFGAMKADENGNLFVGGHYLKSVTFGNQVLQGNASNEHANNFYVSKFNTNGNIDWVKPTINSSSGNSIDNVLIKNNTVFVTGQDGLEIFIDEYSVSGDFLKQTKLPIRGDLAGGFGIDSEDSLYVSGRINDYESSPATTGFILKLGWSSLSGASMVNVPLINCASDEIMITTDPINNATSYEWEILYEDEIVTIVTGEPIFQFIPSMYGIQGECQVRVRGKNNAAAGSFSPFQIIHFDIALSELQIENRCDKIVAKATDSFTWFFNDAPALFPDGQIEISPQETGNYMIKQINACGSKESNIIHYNSSQPFIPNIITPNDDPRNEFFVLSGFFGSSSVYVYNRWGEEVYNSTVYSNDWNGGDLPYGVYFYLIKNSCLKEIRGTLTIAR